MTKRPKTSNKEYKAMDTLFRDVFIQDISKTKGKRENVPKPTKYHTIHTPVKLVAEPSNDR